MSAATPRAGRVGAFATPAVLLMNDTTHCIWANAEKEANVVSMDSILCVQTTNGGGARLVHSMDFFQRAPDVIRFRTDRESFNEPVAAIGTTTQYLIAAVQNVPNNTVEMWISTDAKNWNIAHFPITNIQSPSYTVVESSPSSLWVNTKASTSGQYATLLHSDSNGHEFVFALSHLARQPTTGFVDYERVAGIEGIALANIVENPAQLDQDTSADPRIRSKITFDDGSSWRFIQPPSTDVDGNSFPCDHSTSLQHCSLNLHSISAGRNIGRVFSAEHAPGVLMAVGSVGEALPPYDSCDTFLSVDGGISWKMVRRGPHKYEFGDSGDILLLVKDLGDVDEVWFSSDRGNSWNKKELGMKIKVRALTTDNISASRRFTLVGTLAFDSLPDAKQRQQLIMLDFDSFFSRQCKTFLCIWYRC